MSSNGGRRRAAFERELEDWFVAELASEQDSADRTDLDGPVELEVERPDAELPVAPDRWTYIVVGVAVAAVLVMATAGLLGRRSAPTETAGPGLDVAEAARVICEEYAVEHPSLAYGATPEQIDAVVVDLSVRIARAQTELGAVALDRGAQVAEQSRLLEELALTVDRLSRLARDGERDRIDQTVMNFDLLLLAWGDRMSDLGGTGCAGLPTLRELP